MWFRLIRVGTAVSVLLIVFLALASPALSDDGEGTFAPPKALYLSLGDSIGFGLQLDRLFAMLDNGTYTPDAFNTGYTDVLAARMHQIRPDQQTVNMSCPAESTDTMINGGCFFTSPDGFGLTIHTSYAGSQLDAAVSFLRSHPHQVSPVTVAIGSNDATPIINKTCNFDAACIQKSGLRESLGRGLDHILGAIRAAAPDTEIILVTLYNPFSISHPGSDEVWRRFYTTVEKQAARRNDARVADTSEIVHGTAKVCQLTFLCASGDSHPTDAGYALIADQIFHVAGYQRLIEGDH
jgi:lysophospholipase L1-like esterase